MNLQMIFLITALVMAAVIAGLLAALVMLKQKTVKNQESVNADLKRAIEEKESADDARHSLEALRVADEEYQETLRHMIEYDEVSGLFSKRAFYIHAKKQLEGAVPGSHVLMRCDIDRFKAFNDLFGTLMGDRLLKDLGDFLKDSSPEEVLHCRLQADHFVSLWPKEVFHAEKLTEELNGWFGRYPLDFNFSFCMGIYVIDDPGIDIALMCDRALLAMGTIKGIYNERFAYYDEALRERLMLEQQIVSEMSQALTEGQFQIYYQPLYSYASKKLVGAEALVRWNHPQKGIISPASFIPIFEKNGFITSLDQHVWEQTCIQIKKWCEQGWELPVSVNISRIDVETQDLYDCMQKLTKKYQISPKLLRLEITESAYMGNPAKLIEMVKKLQSKRFTVEMDDFGSGYSSLNILKDVPVDMLKLDLKFLGGGDKPRGGKILSSVIRMARWLDIPIIAEGVESKNQADFLLSLGCEYMQGYYFARPMPAAQFETYLKEGVYQEIACRESEFTKVTLNEFWNPDSELSYLFNNFTGGAAILEYTSGKAEILFSNDEYLKTLQVTREEYEPYGNNLLDRFFEEDRLRFIRMLEDGIKTGGAQAEIVTKPSGKLLKAGRFRAGVYRLARNKDSYIFYLTIERMD